jgi:recombination protein RecA
MANTTTALRHEFGLTWQAPPEPERVPAGIAGIELPRGCLTEIFGPASSGRTTLLFSILAAATARGEICALVDADNAFDPASAASAASAGVRLDRLIWIACDPSAEHALKATDLLVQGGGFGVVALDLGGVPPETARRISLTSWFRLRRAVEHTPTVLLSVARQSNAKTCASLQLECRRECHEWSGAKPARLFRGFHVRAIAMERRTVCSPVFMAKAI